MPFAEYDTSELIHRVAAEIVGLKPKNTSKTIKQATIFFIMILHSDMKSKITFRLHIKLLNTDQ